tara:strand:+ start:178 stop:411 length:234 start_codon:yes stop_codon:yes gene_type:complete
MKNTSNLLLINKLLKILKINNIKKLSKIYRKNYDKWDSLTHLEIIFLLEKKFKKKISIDRINKINSGKNLIKIINEN